MDATKSGLNRNEWEEILAKLGEKTKAKLCLIGSSACIFSGMEGRTSIDLDVWRPNSMFNYMELKKAANDSGIELDPKEEIVNKPYIQLVDPGLVQTGHFDQEQIITTTGALQITRPPIENIIASKLVRGETKDVEDISFLLMQFQPCREAIEAAIKSMPQKARQKAEENLVYLDVLDPDI